MPANRRFRRADGPESVPDEGDAAFHPQTQAKVFRERGYNTSRPGVQMKMRAGENPREPDNRPLQGERRS